MKLDVKKSTNYDDENSLNIRMGHATVEVKPGFDPKLGLDWSEMLMEP